MFVYTVSTPEKSSGETPAKSSPPVKINVVVDEGGAVKSSNSGKQTEEVIPSPAKQSRSSTPTKRPKIEVLEAQESVPLSPVPVKPKSVAPSKPAPGGTSSSSPSPSPSKFLLTLNHPKGEHSKGGGGSTKSAGGGGGGGKLKTVGSTHSMKSLLQMVFLICIS